jgi:hypothetical protein
MAAYQFYNPAPVFFDLLGTQIAKNGTLEFYNAGGTTTERNTWSDPGLTTLNTNPVLLGPDARTEVPIFLDGDYTVVLKNSLGAVIATNQVISGSAAGASIPPLVAGGSLGNDGANLLWEIIQRLPDPTGSPNHYLTTDGANWILLPIPSAPTIPDPEIVVTESSFRAGISSDETKFLIQMGSGSAPATGTFSSTAAISFDVPFSTRPRVFIMQTTDSNPQGPIVASTTSVATTTGFTARMTLATVGTSGSVVNAVPFDWIAIGTKEVPP